MNSTDKAIATINSIMTKTGATYTAGDCVLFDSFETALLLKLLVVVLILVVVVVTLAVVVFLAVVVTLPNSKLWLCAKAAPNAVKPAIEDSLLKKPVLAFDTIAGFSDA